MFAERRERFMAQMGPGVAVLPGASGQAAGDSRHGYRQEDDFYYLTGFEEPEAVCVLSTLHAEHRFVLFVRPKDPKQEQWDGRRAGVEGARERFGTDAAYPIGELDQHLPEYLSNAKRIYFGFGRYPHFESRLHRALGAVRAKVRMGIAAPTEMVDPGTVLHEMRLRKSPAEIELMRKAAEITAEGFDAVIRKTRPGMHEYELQALLDYAYSRSGARRHAYSPIVGAGPNATILHYSENRSRIREGDGVLIDSAAEWEHYAADVTRTIPASSSFTGPQRDLYEMVLRVQAGLIEMVRPGLSLEDIHDACVKGLTEGLVGLGLLEGPAERAIEEKTYQRFYMHKTGHWLGANVHDVGSYRVDGKPRPLEPGMVFTIEPGVYIQEEEATVDARWRGIGIRIEDDLLVTERGFENLTSRIPKTIEEFSALRGY
jgi:Xaa-Pro aminopeptidase